jgi:hypothetical protein
LTAAPNGHLAAQAGAARVVAGAPKSVSYSALLDVARSA